MYGQNVNMIEENMDEGEKWEILGNFGVIIQIVLGGLTFSALLVKRCFEKPKRPALIWILDTSKQLFSALLAHVMNMMIAMEVRKTNQQ